MFQNFKSKHPVKSKPVRLIFFQNQIFKFFVFFICKTIILTEIGRKDKFSEVLF